MRSLYKTESDAAAQAHALHASHTYCRKRKRNSCQGDALCGMGGSGAAVSRLSPALSGMRRPTQLPQPSDV